jgi:RNA polymerase sigma-70 factor (ECF subfamily)
MRKDSKIKIAANESKEYSFSAGEGLRSDIHQIDDKNAYSIEEKMQHKEMIHCYIKFVEKLPKNYYEVYVLSDFDHLSNSEISKKLSISLETVKIRLHRARTKLYDALKANCQCFQNDHGELVGELKQ